MSVNLNGSYGNVGRETLLALHKAAQSDTKIEATEIDEIEKAARADGDFSEGEKGLVAKLREATRDKQEVKDFQIAGFDPAAPELEFGAFNLEVSGKTGQAKAMYVEQLRQAVKDDDSGSDDIIRRLVGDQKRLELTARLNPARLVEAVGPLRSGNYAAEDLAAVVKIFEAVPPAQKAEILATLIKDGDDDTLRALSEKPKAIQDAIQARPDLATGCVEALRSGNYSDEDMAAIVKIFDVVPGPQQAAMLTKLAEAGDDDALRLLSAKSEALKAIATADPEALGKGLEALQSGNYSQEDAAALARLLEAQDPVRQQNFVKDLIQRNNGNDDDSLVEISQKESVLQNLDTATKLKGLHVLADGNISAADRAGMRRILEHLGLLGISDEKACQVAQGLDKLNEAQLNQFATRLDALKPNQKADLLKILTALDADQTKGLLSQPAELGSLLKLMTQPGNSDAQLKAFTDSFAALKTNEKTASLQLIHSLMQDPAPANLRAEVAAGLAKAGSGSEAVGKTLNALGLYLPASTPPAPGTEDLSSRLKNVYMGQYEAGANADYIRDMIKLSKDENFKVTVQGSVDELPHQDPNVVWQDVQRQDALGRFPRARLDPAIAEMTRLGTLESTIHEMQEYGLIKPDESDAKQKDLAAKWFLSSRAMMDAKAAPKIASMEAAGAFTRAALDPVIAQLELQNVIAPGASQADKDKAAKAYLAKVEVYKDRLIDDMVSQEGLSRPDAEALIRDPNRVEIRLTPRSGYIWAEDNKWVKVDGTVTTTPHLRRTLDGAGNVVYPALNKAQAFTDAPVGPAPGQPGSEGHHTAALPANDPNNLLPDGPPGGTSWRGSVTQRDREVDADQLGRSLNGRSADVTTTYNEGGNMVTGTMPNGESYAVVGRDGLLATVFHLEDKNDPAFATAAVNQRIIDIGLDKPYASLSKAEQDQIDVTVARLKATGETFANRDAEVQRAKEFLAKVDISKDLFAKDIGVDRKRIAFVAQPDFHIDMHMRPLGPGQVMINDYSENIKLLNEAKKKAVPGSWEDKELDSMIAHATKMQAVLGPVMDQIAQELKDSGLQVVRAPGVMQGQMTQLKVAKDSPLGRTLGLGADRTFDRSGLEAAFRAKGYTGPEAKQAAEQELTRHVNFMNAVPGTSTGSNQSFYITNATSLPSLSAAYEDYMKATHGIDKVHWIGGGGGKADTKSASELSLDASGGLDCRENH